MRGPCCAVVVLTAVVSLAVAGCSGAETDGSASTETPVPDATATTVGTITTTTPTTTSTPPTATTTAPATTPPTTSSTSTTVPGPSIEEVEAEVAAAYDAVYEGYWACLRAPLACDTSWLLEGSGSAEAMQDTMQALADRDRYVGDDPVGYYVIESIEFDDEFTEATVTSCWWSTAVLYTTPVDPNQPPGPDNPPTIVNNTPSSGFQIETLRFVDDRWRLANAELVGDDSSEDVCGDISG